MRRRGSWAILAVLFWLSASSVASANPATACLHAARLAAKEKAVPVEVMSAITLAETGRKRAGNLTPWPWTINANGIGEWFASKQEAVARVKALQAAGVRSIDVGCFQINLHWHRSAFKSLNHAFDPVVNARYAADFLRGLKAEPESWLDAAGHYHSRTAKPAARYRARVAAILKERQGRAGRQDPAVEVMQASLSRGWISAIGTRPPLIGLTSIRPLLPAKDKPQ